MFVVEVAAPESGPAAYTAAISGGPGEREGSIPAGGERTFDGLPVGSYDVALRGVPEHCPLAGRSPRRVDVSEEAATEVVFALACDPSRITQLLFVSERDGNPDIYVARSDGADVVRLTSDPGEDIQPAWSPDRRRIAFASSRGGSFDIYVMDADGSNVLRRTTAGGVDPAWSPDGRRIAYANVSTKAAFALSTIIASTL